MEKEFTLKVGSYTLETNIKTETDNNSLL